MAKIVKTASDKWTIRVSLTDPLTGRRIQKRVTAPTKRKLDNEIARIRAEWNSGSWIEPDKTTVSGWLRTWHSTYRASAASRYMRGRHIHRIEADDIGRVPLVRLRYSHCQDFVDRLVMEGLAPNSVRAIVSTLSVALTQAVRRQLIASNPTDELLLPSSGARNWTVLDEAQARRLVTDTRDDPLHAAWVLLVTVGIRRGELLALDWRDVDLPAGTLRIERTMTTSERGGLVVGDDAKTQAGQRVIRLPQVCIDALRRHRSRQNERRLAAGEGWVDGGVLFDSGIGERLTADMLYREFRAVKARLGLPASLRLHDLRHSCATLMIATGVPIPAVARVLGHATPAITMSVYAGTIQSMMDTATDRIDDLFRENSASGGTGTG